MTLLKCFVKSYLSLFALLRLTGMTTTNFFSLILFFGLYYIYYHFSDSSFECKIASHDYLLSGLLSAFFSLLTIFCTYNNITSHLSNFAFCAITLFMSGLGIWIIFFHFILLLLVKTSSIHISNSYFPVIWLPYLTFFFCVLAWLPYFLYEFPGIMTPDSISQYSQLIGASGYSNHHPIVHTLLFGELYNLGLHVTNNPIIAISFYTAFQMFFMAFVAAYVIRSLQLAGVRTSICIVVMCFYALVPYNAIYSVHIWKDIIFAGGFTLFIACLLRFLLHDTRYIAKRSDIFTLYIPYLVSGFIICLFRHNGWYVFLISTPFILLTLHEQLKKIIPLQLIIIALVLFVKYPCMEIYEIPQSDFVESVSIPVQQIARVISNGETLSQDQLDSLSPFMDVNQVSSLYDPICSDNIKNLIRRTDSQYLETHKQEFFSLWIDIGLKHPKAYFDAFVDQTNGFWYPDVYSEIGLFDGIIQNDYNLTWQPIIRGPIIVKIKEIIFKLHTLLPLWGLLWSMGTMFWIVLTNCFICIRNVKFANLLLGLPIILLIATLCIATPVANEFRYAYALFFGLPIYLLMPYIKTNV